MKVKVTQLCPTLCDPMDCRVHGILQATILEWVTFPFSRGSSQPRDRTQVSCIAGGFFTSWATLKCIAKWFIYIYKIFHLHLPYKLLQNIECISCAIQLVLIAYLFCIWYDVCVFNPELLIYPSFLHLFHFGDHKFVFYVYGSIYILQITSLVSFFSDSMYKQ